MSSYEKRKYDLENEKEAFSNAAEMDSELGLTPDMPSDKELERRYPYLKWTTPNHSVFY